MTEHYEVGDAVPPEMTPGERISYHPTQGLTYDPSDPKYWDKQR